MLTGTGRPGREQDHLIYKLVNAPSSAGMKAHSGAICNAKTSGIRHDTPSLPPRATVRRSGWPRGRG